MTAAAQIFAAVPVADLEFLPPQALSGVVPFADIEPVAGHAELQGVIPVPEIEIAARHSELEGPFLIIKEVEQPLNVRYYTATTTVQAHRIVRQRAGGMVEHASSATIGHGNSIVGLARNNAAPNGPVQVLREGPITFTGWSWTAGKPIFLSASGQMSQTPPMAGYVIQVGFAISTQSMHVRIGRPIFRS